MTNTTFWLMATMISHGPRIEFDIDVINDLISELCDHFAARYNAPHRRRTILNAKKPTWLYSFLREFVELTPERLPHETDWVDNTTLLCEAPKNINGKRGSPNEQWNVLRAPKPLRLRWLAHAQLTRSSNYPLLIHCPRL